MRATSADRSTLYAAKSHSPGMPWDFAIKGERRRWELTVNHWDEDLVELDVTREPLSVYYPLDAPAKKT